MVLLVHTMKLYKRLSYCLCVTYDIPLYTLFDALDRFQGDFLPCNTINFIETPSVALVIYLDHLCSPLAFVWGIKQVE